MVVPLKKSIEITAQVNTKLQVTSQTTSKSPTSFKNVVNKVFSFTIFVV